MTEVMPWENLPKTNRSKTPSEIIKERIRGRKTPTSSKTAPHKPLTVYGKEVKCINTSEAMEKLKNGKELTELEREVLDKYWASKYYGLKPHLEKTKVDRTDVIYNKGQFEKTVITESKNSSAHLPKKLAKTELPQKTIPTASDLYFQQSRRLENSARTKSPGYRPLDNNPKGGFERWMEKFGELADKKAELTENGSKIADKFAKIMEFCKKYDKFFKA